VNFSTLRYKRTAPTPARSPNSGELMMRAMCAELVHGVRRPEASRGMNMSRYISKSISLLTLSLVICCGLYLLSPRVIGQPRFSFQANGSMLTDPDSNIVRSPQITQQFPKDEYSSLARPPRLTRHQSRLRRRRLHRTVSSIGRIATLAKQRLHCYSAQVHGSAIFTIVNDRASLFSSLRGV
jgi:hypothetical protein